MKKRVMIALAIVLMAVLMLMTGCTVIQPKAIYEDDSMDLDGAEIIQIKGGSTDIKVVQEDRDDIYVKLKTYKNGPGFEMEGGDKIKISIVEKERYTIRERSYAPLLTVYIPEEYSDVIKIDVESSDVEVKDITLPTVEINLESGDLTGDNWEVAALDITAGSSEVYLDNIITEHTSITTKSGDVRLTSFEGDLNGQSKSGEIRITYSNFANTLNFNGDSSDFSITLNQGDLNVEMDLKGDEIRVDGAKAVKESFSKQYGEGEYQVNITTKSGDIKIN